MSGVAPYVSLISGYIPAAVKDAAGLCPKISEAVRHITWLSVERVFWPPQDTVRLLLVLGYTDGFQIWDLQDPANVHEICSKQDKAVVQARLLPIPLAPSGMASSMGFGSAGAAAEAESQEQTDTGGASPEASQVSQPPLPLGLASAPLMAYLHRGAPALVRLFSLRHHDDVHLLRLTEPARCLQASRRYFAVGFARRVELYDALAFQALFSVDCNPAAGQTFALGHRWLAYNLVPQQPPSASGSLGSAAGGLLVGGPQKLQSAVYDGLQHLGRGAQRAFDHILMPPPEGSEQQPLAPAHGGIVAVRDAVTQRVIGRIEDHVEPVEAMAWDPSGLQLVTGAALGHRVLVHRALLGSEQALVMHDSAEGGLSLGSVVFQHIYTLSRGYTPAVISDISVSDDGQLVAVSSAKGTTHVYRLPPLHAAAFGQQLLDTGAVRLTPAQSCNASGMPFSGGIVGAPRPLQLSACTRVKLGHVLLQEGLLPKCGFLAPEKPGSGGTTAKSRGDSGHRMYVATRAGAIALYSLNAGPAQGNLGAGAMSGAGAAGAAGGAGADAGAVGFEVIGAEESAEGADMSPAAGESGEWHAQLMREVRFCRPLRHFAERRLTPYDLQPPSATGQTRSRGSSSSVSSVAVAAAAAAAAGAAIAAAAGSDVPPSPPLGPGQAAGQWTNLSTPKQRSPLLGPRPGSPPPTDLQLGPAAATALAQLGGGPPRSSTAAGSSEPSRWLSSVELKTHVPREVPLWLCPQLTFRTYSSDIPAGELNADLRAGRAPANRRTVTITRERAGDGVRYDGAPDSEERLSRLVGALGARVGEGCSGGYPSTAQLQAPVAVRTPPFRAAPGGGSVCLAPAWGALGSQRLDADFEGSLEPLDGVTDGFEVVEEDWLKA